MLIALCSHSLAQACEVAIQVAVQHSIEHTQMTLCATARFCQSSVCRHKPDTEQNNVSLQADKLRDQADQMRRQALLQLQGRSYLPTEDPAAYQRNMAAANAAVRSFEQPSVACGFSCR